MSDPAQDMSFPGAADGGDSVSVPKVKIAAPYYRIDFATIIGLFSALGLIVAAIAVSENDANFLNGPSFLMVILGTIAATAISYTSDELARAGHIIANSLFRRMTDHPKLSKALIDLAVVAKKKGILAIVNYENELIKDPFLAHSMQMVVDGYLPDEIDKLLQQEVEAQLERHQRAATIPRRASEIAPAMGLIGTLVGLVFMLANLEDPESIGPAMAVALLTTFYGAILGTIVMAPLAVKLEKNSSDEAMHKNLIRIAAVSIAKQENPRRLEMLLNSELPPSKRITYFD